MLTRLLREMQPPDLCSGFCVARYLKHTTLPIGKAYSDKPPPENMLSGVIIQTAPLKRVGDEFRDTFQRLSIRMFAWFFVWKDVKCDKKKWVRGEYRDLACSIEIVHHAVIISFLEVKTRLRKWRGVVPLAVGARKPLLFHFGEGVGMLQYCFLEGYFTCVGDIRKKRHFLKRK